MRGSLLLENLEERALLAPVVVYRVNAGGPSLVGNPPWSADSNTAPSPFGNASAAGSNAFTIAAAIDLSHPSIPAGTPVSLFQSERWDPPGGAEMQWNFPVTPGEYEVRLYFAEIYSGAQQVGARVFDVSIEGTLVLDNYDVFAEVGGFKGVMKSFVLASDANMDIDFGHVVENPMIKGIEIVGATSSASQLGASQNSVGFGGVAVGATASQAVQLTNLGGPGDPAIIVSSTTIVGTDGGQFTDSFNDLAPVTLAPGQSTTISVAFAPTSGGTKSASLQITHSGSNSPLLIPLTGTGASPSGGGTTPVYRVNAGGPSIAGTPSWVADSSAAPSQFSNASTAASNAASTTTVIDMSHPSVPAGTPSALFQSERWDSAAGAEMQWNFPVTPGEYEVRLYFAEIYSGALTAGARVFDVSIEGGLVLDNYDVFADVGGFKGVMKSFQVTSDANLDIDFAHVTENPAIKGIEILAGAAAPNQLGSSQSSVAFANVSVGATASQTVVLTNLGAPGDPAITISGTSISGPAASQFSDSFNDAASLALTPGQSATISVTFSPTSTGSKSATLAVVHSGSNTPLLIPLSGTGGSSTTPVGFGKSTLAGTSSVQPTSLQFGPDGRLYVAHVDGLIKVYNVTRNGPNNYAVTATETITAIQSIPNHDDNGTLNPNVIGRQVTGILVTGTAANPVIYVSSSDPRTGAGPSGQDFNLDTNSGIISRLTWNGITWVKLDLVRGLPRSEENHASNGLQLDPVSNTLYVAQGGHTNMGAPSNNFAFLPEYALSAAILAIDLNAIGQTTYDLPTLNDETRPGANDANDPFGGNDGKNQAKLVPGGPVQVHSPGYRNPYDLLIARSGKMYTIDNGPNAGWGAMPVGEGPSGGCSNAINEPGTTHPDSLHFVSGPGYYGGFPNPTRGNAANTFNSSNPQSPVATANPVQCDYRDPGPANGALATFPNSTNGLAEYTASNFGGAMSGDLLAASFSNGIFRLKPNAASTGLVLQETLFNTVGQIPLDITTQGDAGPLPGTIWVADYVLGSVIVFEPNDFGAPGSTCTGANNSALDEDSDGYNNADEIANATNPCSAADVPHDWDHDFLSDLSDPNDDNDSQPDTSDPFAIDAANGRNTNLPVLYSWENNAASPGGLLNLGFTGLMTNGTSNYAALFDPAGMTAGGAAGVVTVDAVPEGDALGGSNTQQFGFQFGVNVGPASGPFTAHTRIVAPFAGLAPQDNQSMGLFVGTGDQDNYVKLVVSANGGSGGIAFLKEVSGAVTTRPQAAVSLPGPNFIDLYLIVDPVGSTVQPSYSVTVGGVTGPRTNLGSTEAFPPGWLTASSGLAIGILSTSSGPGPAFPATWDFIEVAADSGPVNQPVAYRVNAGGPLLAGNTPWGTDTEFAPSPYVNATLAGNKASTVTNPIDMSHPSIPAGTPQAVFQSERWDPLSGAEMQWNFPVAPGTYEVRLYFAENFAWTQQVGRRVFDVSIEGNLVLDNYDIFADVGAFKAVMKSFVVTSDANLDIDFGHVVENPTIKGIEILPATPIQAVASVNATRQSDTSAQGRPSKTKPAQGPPSNAKRKNGKTADSPTPTGHARKPPKHPNVITAATETDRTDAVDASIGQMLEERPSNRRSRGRAVKIR